MITYSYFFRPFRVFSKNFPGLNLTLTRGAMRQGTPLCGLRPGRSVCFQGTKVPKPWNWIALSSSSASVKTSSKASKNRRDWQEATPSFAANSVITSVLFILLCYVSFYYTMSPYSFCTCKSVAKAPSVPTGEGGYFATLFSSGQRKITRSPDGLRHHCCRHLLREPFRVRRSTPSRRCCR